MQQVGWYTHQYSTSVSSPPRQHTLLALALLFPGVRFKPSGTADSFVTLFSDRASQPVIVVSSHLLRHSPLQLLDAIGTGIQIGASSHLYNLPSYVRTVITQQVASHWLRAPPLQQERLTVRL